MNGEKRKLEYGEVTKIAYGDMNIRVYDTKDAIDDRVIILEKDGRGVVVELPALRRNIEELAHYLEDENVTIEGKLVSYHAAGSSFLPDVKNYLTESAAKYNSTGGGAALIGNFAKAFGPEFDSSAVGSGEDLQGGEFEIAGIGLTIIPNGDAFEITIPDAKAVYMHMLGHDCHSIIAGPAHADAVIAGLQKYLDDGFELFLSAHYGPEDRSDVQTKISYIEGLKDIAARCSSAEEFSDAVKERYPGYSGENYLRMTAGMFFPQ